MRALFTKKNLLIFVMVLVSFGIVELLRYTGIVASDLFDSTVALICTNIILALSLNLITGFTGQFSLGHAGFMAIGAYTCALIVIKYPTPLGFVGGVLAGGVTATLFGVLIGFPTLRLKGDYLAIATLGMAEIIRVIFQNLTITGGASGLSVPSLGMMGMPVLPWLFGFAVITFIVINNFIKSSRGRACIAVREDEIAAESMGINSTKYKIMAFAVGAFFAGLAGGLFASYSYIILPKAFGFLQSINILVIVVLGGLGSLSGSVVSAILLTLLTTWLTTSSTFTTWLSGLAGIFPGATNGVNNIIYALLLIIIMLFRPQGLMGTVEVGDLLKKPFRKKERVE